MRQNYLSFRRLDSRLRHGVIREEVSRIFDGEQQVLGGLMDRAKDDFLLLDLAPTKQWPGGLDHLTGILKIFFRYQVTAPQAVDRGPAGAWEKNLCESSIAARLR